MKWNSIWAIICFAISCWNIAAGFDNVSASASSESISSNLALLEIQFDPIGSGRNEVRARVQNLTDKPQVLGINVQTTSHISTPDERGWGTQHIYNVGAHKEQWCSFIFRIYDKPDDKTRILVGLSNPISAGAGSLRDSLEKKYSGSVLEHRNAIEFPVLPATPALAKAIQERFQEIQNLLLQESYKDAWVAFTYGNQMADFWGKRSSFVREMRSETRLFGWEKAQFLDLVPSKVESSEGLAILTAMLGGKPWRIAFSRENNQWKIDSVEGYTDRALYYKSWENRLLPQMAKRTTPNFDIYFGKGSPASHDIEQIIKNRETAYQKIRAFFEMKEDARIRLVFFDSEKSKLRETGTHGMGFANGLKIIEVYNSKEQLDPYHETAHVFMYNVGYPPALFAEGFAVYMSEYLGAPPLINLGGGRMSIFERVRNLKKENNWIPIEELLTYTDIGPQETRPPVSYAEAAAFVKFLIEAHGKQKFLEAYKALQNSTEETAHRQNQKTLERIYGKAIKDLCIEWYRAMKI